MSTTQLNTTRSEQKVKEFLAKDQSFKRKTQTFENRFYASAEEVFVQLCPARELDWIDGWDVDLIYTSTGYMEENCIFTTPDTNAMGSGVWVTTRYEPQANRVELVRIEKSLVEQVRISVRDNEDGTSTAVWSLTYTALDEQGNAIIESIPDEDPEFPATLEHFLTTGEMMKTD